MGTSNAVERAKRREEIEKRREEAERYLKAKELVIAREACDSPCSECARYSYTAQTWDSPAEESCTGVEDNMWTHGGCMYYKEMLHI